VAGALGRHRIPLIHNLEIDERAFELSARTPPAAGDPEPDGVSVAVIFEEPRRYLDDADRTISSSSRRASRRQALRAVFYTREFFAQCARRMTPGGVIAIRLAAAENVWPRPLALRTASIVAAMQQVFGSIEMLAGATLYVFASNSPSRPTLRCCPLGCSPAASAPA